ncbi:ABC transporter permease subunit, partial [Enterococcus faecium]|uniref:ABC transporter permease subunit n=1 Tax=Enterococcus faecium TaxID=1352 RepID=UPI003CC56E0A
RSRVNSGLFLAIIAIIFFWLFMKKTSLGFEIRSVGLNPFASEYAGMSSNRTIVLSMVISGAMAGLGGVVEGLGTYQNLFVQPTT